jgi:hypothetical protein
MNATDGAWPVVVIGAGAAGVTAAIFAARGGVSVLVVETRPQPGAKIRVSGGGRCNVLPSRVSIDDFHTAGSRHAMRNVLLSWPLAEVSAFFEGDLGVALKVEATGKVFPQSDDAREVVSALLGACVAAGVELRAPFRASTVRRDADGFVVENADGGGVRCRYLVLATGGLSLPKTGSDGFGLAAAQAMGHTLVPTYPALVPLVTEEAGWRDLSGVSAHATITARRGDRVLERCEGSLLFTHQGFSGPVVLDISRHVTPRGAGGVELRVRWGHVPDWDAYLRGGGGITAGAALRPHLPQRLTALLLARAGVNAGGRLSELTRASRARLVEVLEDFRLPVAGSEGYRKAEVTGGGVPLSEVSTKTLESRVVPGLYLCGEILDVTGRLGGYNFLWAWVTGRKVGSALATIHGRQ